MRWRGTIVGLGAAAVLWGCTTHRAVRDHSLVVSIGADADLLLPPFIATTQGVEVADQIFERLATPDSTLDTFGDASYTPCLADRWTWSPDSLSIAFHIDPRARWQDGRPVTANDVRYSFGVYLDTASGALATAQLANIDSASVRDSLTAVVWFHRRSLEQFYAATYEVRILPAHLLDTIPDARLRTSAFARAPLGSGPYRFSRWVAGSHIDLAANTGYRGGRPAFDRLIFSVTPDPVVAIARLASHELDFVDRVPAPQIATLAARHDVRLLRWPSEETCFLLFNLRDPAHPDRPHPVLGDWRVRRAIQLALDRHAVVLSALGETARVAEGPLPSQLMDTVVAPDTAPDLAGARRLLASAGWRIDKRTGMRRRHGQTLTMRLLVPTSSAERMDAAVLIQEQLRAVGIRTSIEATEMNTSIARLIAGTFDATLLNLNWEPSPSSARQVWSSTSLPPRGSNLGRYVNPAFDALLDSAFRAQSASSSRAFYRRAWSLLTHDVPAVWLYQLVNVGAVRASIAPVGMRPDAWWADIARWRSSQRAEP